jgi:hypothetical protein
MNTLEQQPDDLVAMTYLSHSVIKNNKIQQECDNIKQVASVNNAAKHISGLLIFCRNRFIQRLEGPAGMVQSLVEHIKQDKRHKNFTLLHSGEIKERYFKDWSQMSVITGGAHFDDLEKLFLKLEVGGRDSLDDKESQFVLSFLKYYQD